MPNKKISQLDTRSVPSLSDYLVVADPSTGYAYKELGSTFVDLAKATLVPYTGATASLNLGAYNLTATQIIKVGGTSTQFLKADGSVDSTTYMNRAVYDTDADGIVDAAMAMRTIGRNATGATLYKGTVVYISGSTGALPNFVKAQANSEATSAGTFGVVYADIANNSDGYVVTIGTIDTLDTRTTATNPFTSVTLADGDTVYLDPNTAGYITNVKPSAPNHLVYVGKVTRTSPTNGTIVYRIQNGYELDEIHDVSITSKANNDVLVYESATTLWKNKSIATILGYTPANDSLVMHLAGSETATGYKTFSIGLQTNTGDNYLNYTSGATYIGYNAAPVGGYKLAVQGTARVTSTLTAGSLALATGQVISGSGSGNWTFTNSGGGGWYFEWIQNSVTAMTLSTENSLLLGTTTSVASSILTLSSTAKGILLPRMTTAQKNAIATPATSLLLYDTDLAAFQYYSGSAWTGLGGGISGSGTAGQVTYWTGSSAVGGSSNLFWDNTNGRLGIGTNSPQSILHLKPSASATSGIILENPSSSSTYLPTSIFVTGLGQTTSGANNSSLIVFVAGPNSGNTSDGPYFHIKGNNYSGFGGQRGNITFYSGNVSSPTGNDGSLIFGSPSAFIDFNTGSSLTTKMRLYNNGNLNLQNGGTFTDAGYRLDVNGTGASTGALRVTGGLSLFQGGKMTIAASTTSYASLNIPSGTAPTSPANGDIWFDGTDIKMRIAGTTKTFTLI